MSAHATIRSRHPNAKSNVRTARASIEVVAWSALVLGASARFVSADGPDGVRVAARARATERVVHQFDFDERAEGNLEDVPKFWEVFRPKGFPHYAGGLFDFEVGHDAPPSFHLSSEGRNVAFQYVGPDTRVRENSEYRIEAWIKPDRLTYARACVSAHFLDRFGHVMADTVVRSRYIGGAGDDWETVSLRLPAAPSEAFAVGLVAWVIQQPVWDQSVHAARHIPHRDVFGGAWFDDIRVFRLPRVRLSSSAVGQVLSSDGPQEVWVTLADHDDPSLMGTLSIFDADGSLVETHDYPVVLESGAGPKKLAVDHLEPGLYHAELAVGARGETFMTRTLDFVRLAPRRGRRGALARSFGIAIDPAMRSDPVTEGSLLLTQRVNAVKLPVWSGRAEESRSVSERRKLDRMLHELVQNNFSVTAVLHGAPGLIVRAAGAYAPSLVDLLSTDPDAWEQHLAIVAAPHAGTFRWWQIGADGDDSILSAERLSDVLQNVRDALRPFITDPQLTVPGDAGAAAPPSAPAVGHVTVTLGPALPAESFGSVLAAWQAAGFETVSVRVDPLDATLYARRPRLTDWARRLILARYAGARTVFAPQTWRVRETARRRITEPKETYVILRTIADILGDAGPGPKLDLADGIRCVSFRGAGRSILAMWTEGTGERTVRPAVQLGRASRQIDLWGVVTPLNRDETGRHIVTLTDAPIFIDGVENWLVDLMASLSVSPVHVESGNENVPLTVSWAYRGSHDVAGRIEFDVPRSWEISPRGVDFRLTPDRIERIPVVVRLPLTESAGRKAFRARVRVTDPPYSLDVPLRFELGLQGIAAWGMAYVEGDQLILEHAVTNNSATTVSFRSAASVPGRERQYRPFTDLQPGDTQTAIFRFKQGATLIGRRVRMVLRELNDGRRTHTLELNVP